MIPDSALDSVRDQGSLFAFLRDQLRWPVDPEDTFTYDVPGLDEETATRVEVSRLVPFSGDDPFVLLLAEFRPDFRRGALRRVLQAIRAEMRKKAAYQGKGLEDLVFLCVPPDYGFVRFAHFREQEGRQPKLAVFGWERGRVGETRTLRDINLPALGLGRNLLDEPDWSRATVDRWRGAWDVEQVTNEFFRRYREVFNQVEESLQRAIPDAGRRRMYTQRLFNRLLFIAFIERKGWLRFEDRTDYLAALFEAAERDGESFLNDRLYWAFFAGLGTLVEEAEAHSIEELVQLRGEVPFLNGGLFEMEDELDTRGAVTLANDCFRPILCGPEALFNRFQFTVTESTPDDIDVAVDPEMLGKVFEELVTGRHETGSYYTPKPVVSFMCREALKCYLETALEVGGDQSAERDAIAAFVDEHQPEGLAKPEAVLEALRRVRACDPACGSGAYLLGMLHELLDLRACLFATRRLDQKSIYERKLEIIQNSLYGVDLDPFAVNIARLRLWLSLSVDYQGATPPPLPNLDFKVEVGDSLLGPAPSPAGTGDMFRQKLIEQFRDLKRQFLTAHGQEKSRLRQEIAQVREDLAVHEHRGGAGQGFEWQVEFAEAFFPEEPAYTIGGAFNFGYGLTERPRPGGFDIVVANPPYVRADAQFRHVTDQAERLRLIEEWRAYRRALVVSRLYSTLYEKWDLYIPFLERSFELLAPAGDMVLIIPDAYNAAKYTGKSHRFLVSSARIRRIDFCTDIPLFSAGVRNTILNVAKAKAGPSHAPDRVRRHGRSAADFETNAAWLPTGNQRDMAEDLFRPSGQRTRSATAHCVELHMICYISKGMVLHADEKKAHLAFRAEDLVADAPDDNHPAAFFEGKDFTRWLVDRVRYLEYGTWRAPALFSRPTFPELYSAPVKLVAKDLAGYRQAVVYDDRQLMHNHSAWSFVPWDALAGISNRSIAMSARYGHKGQAGDRAQREAISRSFCPKYMLAVMNSAAVTTWFNDGNRRSRLHIYPDDWRFLPIPVASIEAQAAVAELVDRLFLVLTGAPEACPEHPVRRWPRYDEDTGEQVVAIEAEIDARVAALYGL